MASSAEEDYASEGPSRSARGPKRGPGRPPKRVPPPPLTHSGVVRDPTDPENLVELVYWNPMMFKKLFEFFKNVHASEIHVKCTPQTATDAASITFFTRDISKRCKIIAKIPGCSMNHFYCERVVTFGLMRSDIEKVFGSIDKSFFKFTLLLKHDDLDYVTIIFKDAEVEKECNYKLSVSTFDEDYELFAAEADTKPEALKAYPVEFTLSAKKFKKTMSDALNFSETLMVEKLGTGPLKLSYNKVGHSYCEVYRSDERISLRHSVGPNEIFQCTMRVRDVKCFATAMVTDDVQIFCKADAELLFRASMDDLTLCSFMSNE